MIALDLDGTLKSSDATGRIILPKTKKILIELAKKGIVIVLASGRPTAGLYAEANELQLNDFGGYLLSFNGAKVVNYQTKEVIFQKIFDATTAHLVYDRAKKYNLAVMTYTDQEIITEDSADQYVQIESKINNMPLKQVDDFKAVVDYPVNKVLLTGKPEYAAKIEDEFKAPFKDSLSIYRSAAYFIEVMAKDIDKAASLKVLADSLNIRPEEIISFGDGYNDQAMFKEAGHCIAMGNAVDVLKEKATYVTDTIENDGILKALYHEKVI